MRGAPEMAEALDAQDRARRAYVAAHKKYERSRSRSSAPSSELENPASSGSFDAASLTRAVADLENEKETLSKRIEAVERKIETRVGGGDGDGKARRGAAAAAREETRADQRPGAPPVRARAR